MKKIFDGKAFERYSKAVGITSLEEAIERKLQEEETKKENFQKMLAKQEEKRAQEIREAEEYEAWYNEFNTPTDSLKSEDPDQ